MVYFIEEHSSRRFIAFFFTHFDSTYKGFILPVAPEEVIYVRLIPLPSIILLFPLIFQIFSYFIIEFNATLTTLQFITKVNIFSLALSCICVILISIFVALSQLRSALKHQIARSVNELLRIDWKATLSIYTAMVLFGLNGMLFVTWSKTLAAEERFANATEYWITFSIFAVLAILGILRLRWLWAQRLGDAIRWVE